MNKNTMKALALSVASVALATAANANTVANGFYGGGGTGTDPIIGQMFGCLNGGLTAAQCPGVPVGDLGELTGTNITWVGVGSGNGLENLINSAGASPTIALNTISDGKFNGVALTAAQLSSLSFPTWDLTDSDAPLDAIDPLTGSAYSAEYTTTQASYRGTLFQLPLAGTAVLIGYNLPAYNATSNPSGANFTTAYSASAGESTQLALSKDAMCYIYTGLDAAGNIRGTTVWSTTSVGGSTASGQWVEAPVASGATVSATPHDFNNYVFTKYNIFTVGGKSFPEPLYIGGATGLTPNAIELDEETARAYTTTAGSIVATAPVIQPHLRSDASGTTYLLTLYLSKSCAGYDISVPTVDPVTGATISIAGTAPSYVGNNWWNGVSTQPTTPSWVTVDANGSGGMYNVIKAPANVGVVGYLQPSTSRLQPQNPSGFPSAYVQNYQQKFVAPTNTAINAAFVQKPAPAYSVFASGKNKGLSGTTAKVWGGTLSNAIFSPLKGGQTAYAIGGLTYITGYQCYPASATNDRADVILDFFKALTSGDFNTILQSSAFVPLTYDLAVNGKSVTLEEQVFNTLNDGIELTTYTKSALTTPLPNTVHNTYTAIQKITGTETFGSGSFNGTGPYVCKIFASDGNH